MDPSVANIQQVLSIDQIRSIRTNNDYVDRPVTVSFKQARSSPSLSQAPKQDWSQDHLVSSTHQDLHRSQNHHNQIQHLQHDMSHSNTISSVSRSTTASDQRLLTGITPSHSGSSLIRMQSKPGDLKPEELMKRMIEKPNLHVGHLFICEECGKCKCDECTLAYSLPSCWVCNQRCLCSPESVIEYGTCLCCVKGLFYHCSTDDEDNCADNPCSFSQGSCCARWATMSFLSLFMPCLCCYLPARGCLKLCQRGYDRVKRPGCSCKNHTNTVCRKISSSSGTPFPRPLDKPV
ncbi:protein sprouty homolog 3 [Microcaecilia unicolor]|uniref:Protein sprouty homolog 3 n=1 Tax=Microcaecilia unicolor TaxID=1415580 RepID=A0A6P7YLU2_9AMPH|nr:protein sprouty homolog 3 [Microcaecilia unicolor]